MNFLFLELVHTKNHTMEVELKEKIVKNKIC